MRSHSHQLQYSEGPLRVATGAKGGVVKTLGQSRRTPAWGERTSESDILFFGTRARELGNWDRWASGVRSNCGNATGPEVNESLVYQGCEPTADEEFVYLGVNRWWARIVNLRTMRDKNDHSLPRSR